MRRKHADRLAGYLMDHARSDMDLDAARALRQLSRVYDVAYELVYAKTQEHSRATYAELIDLIKGKAE